MKTIHNNSGMTQEEISKLKPIGFCKNNWRKRFVTVYEIPGEQEVISVGEALDRSSVTICRESRDGFRNALALFPQIYIYD